MNLCRLCENSDELRDSHIYPEFFYDGIYDHKHRYNVLTTDPSGRNSFEQKGAREKLLCSRCENYIGKFERYASLFFKGKLPNVTEQRIGSLKVFYGLDYTKFKLFTLSLTWRASVANHPFFKQVNLGKHQEAIRMMLLQGDPGPWNLYPCMMGHHFLYTAATVDVIVEPRHVRVHGQHAYYLVIREFSYLQFIASEPPKQSLPQAFLQTDGTLVVGTREALSVGPIKNFMEEFEHLGRPSRI